MANIDTYLQQIMAAIYGEDVRGAIHDAIQEINEVVENWESGLMDTTLTSTTLPAQGKAVGDAIKKLEDNAILKSAYNNLTALTNTYLTNNNITSLTQLASERVYSFNAVTVITDFPTDAPATFSGSLLKTVSNSTGWTMYLLISNTGRTWSGTSVGANMRWDTLPSTTKTLADSLASHAVLSSSYYGYNTLTDSYLNTNNITSLTQLDNDVIYSLSGVTVLTDLPTEAPSPFNGALVKMISYSNGWPIYILISNTGRAWVGTSSGSTMRWDTTTSDNAILRSTFYNIGVLSDAYLNSKNITSLTELTPNVIYSFSNVSVITDFPEGTTPFYGALIKTNSGTTGWPIYILVNNAGRSWIGTSSGATMRWQTQESGSYYDINQQLSNIYGKNVVLVGDSIMYGSHMTDYAPGSRAVYTKNGVTIYNNLSTKVWSYGFAGYLESEYGCTVINQAFPGCSWGDVVTGIDTLIPAGNDYAIIMLGVNDWGSPSSVSGYMQTVITYCKNNNITPIFITPYPAQTYKASLARIRGIIKSYKYEVADFYSTFNALLFAMGIDITTLFDDQIHYNDAGQPYILESIKRCLKI